MKIIRKKSLVRSPNNYFVEDGNFMKFRELSVRYTFEKTQLRSIYGWWVNRLTIGGNGRRSPGRRISHSARPIRLVTECKLHPLTANNFHISRYYQFSVPIKPIVQIYQK